MKRVVARKKKEGSAAEIASRSAKRILRRKLEAVKMKNTISITNREENVAQPKRLKKWKVSRQSWR